MAYTVNNYKTKRELKADIKAGVVVKVFQPGPFGPDVKDGTVAVEGPHYPEPHRWYASVEVKNGIITKFKG